MIRRQHVRFGTRLRLPCNAHLGALINRLQHLTQRRWAVDGLRDDRSGRCSKYHAQQVAHCSVSNVYHLVLLACNIALLAIGAQAPAWLAGGSLALDDAGFVAVNAFQQSTSHPNVFASGDVASRVDAPHPRSGVYAVRSGPPLMANLRAALACRPLTPYRPPTRTLNLLSCGGRYAIAVWGGLSVEGKWVWHLKDRIDKRFVSQYGNFA